MYYRKFYSSVELGIYCETHSRESSILREFDWGMCPSVAIEEAFSVLHRHAICRIYKSRGMSKLQVKEFKKRVLNHLRQQAGRRT